MIEIPNTNGFYFVSNNGDIISKKRPTTHGGKLKKNISTGYEQISLCINGVKETKLVHILVANAFIPNPNNFKEVNHKDGNKRNNKFDNLEWCSRAENQKHKVDVLGHRSTGKKLSKENVFEILGSKSIICQTLAEKFNVSRLCIYLVRRGKTYRQFFEDFNKAELNKTK